MPEAARTIHTVTPDCQVRAREDARTLAAPLHAYAFGAQRHSLPHVQLVQVHSAEQRWEVWFWSVMVFLLGW